MSAYYSHSNYSPYSYNIWWSLSSLHRQSYSPASYFSLTLPLDTSPLWIVRIFSFFFFFVSFCVILDLFIQLFNCINFCISLIKYLIIKYYYYYSSRFLNTHTWTRSLARVVNRGSRALIQLGILFRMMRFGSNLGSRRGRIVGSSGVLGFQKSRN